MSEQAYRDLAVLAGEATDDAWEAMSESYATLGHALVAVLQRTGQVRLPADWEQLAQGFVVTFDPLPDGSVRAQAVRRGEVQSDSAEGAERLRRKWERMYRRRNA